MEVVNVQPRDIYIHYIYVPDKATTIRWWFSTKRHNIAFGLYRTASQAQISSSDVLFHTQDTPRGSPLPAPGARPLNAGGNGASTGATNATSSSRRPTLTYEDSKDSSDGMADGSTLHASSASIRSRRKSVASQKLADNMDEILPIEHCNSADNKVSGHYVVDEPGSYALVFDNTFSRNTSKMLTFSVALGEREQVSGSEQTELAGWILKKRRKKMQGWAKRWFNLSSTGVLSYSIHNKSICRGSIQIFLSTISVNPQQSLIHIDSGTMIYHLKTLTPEDFEKWTKALRFHKSQNMANGHHVIEGNLGGPTVSENELANQAREAAAVREGLAAIDGQINSIRSILDTMGNMIGDGMNSPSSLSPSRARFNFRRSSSKSLSSARPPQINASPSSSSRSGVSDNTAAEEVDASQMHFRLLSAMNKLKKQRDEVFDAFDKNQTHWNKIYAAYKDLSESNYASRDNGFTVENDDMVSARDSLSTGKRTSSFISYRTSNQSEIFFDAEEIVISDDDADYALAENDIIDENEEDDEDLADSDQKSTLSGMLAEDVKRRQLLPSPSVGDAASALSIFRKNVGKDLSTIAMPISMNEPLNLLQRACEELEYCQMLARANQSETSIDRLMYVTCFAISGYASSQYRTGRKPFNPMMCETYECIRPDKGFRFIAEKVKHNPPVVAAYAESRNFRFWQNAAVKSKFWGKSMELMSEGTVHITLNEHDDHYTYTKPSSWVRNMIAGNKYLEHVGEMRVHNHKTGEYAIVQFKEGTGGGLFGVPTKRNIITVSICNSSGKTIKKVIGKWSESLACEIGKDQYEVIWRAQSPGIPDHEDYYGFTKFCVELNEITELERGKIPITDTRYRPDQKMYEEGDVDEADVEKQRIEQRQRDQRKKFEVEGGQFVPKWFELADQEYELSEDGESTTCQIWKYNGQYWPARESQNWPSDLLQLW
ncbi:Oxysterol-binding protein 3 [Umbelopsis sp. WA50703]